MAGELTPEMESSLMVLEHAIPEKVDRYAGFMDRLSTEATMLQMKADKYAKAAKAISNLYDKLRDNLGQLMEANKLEKLCGKEEMFKLVGSKAKVVIDNLTELKD